MRAITHFRKIWIGAVFIGFVLFLLSSNSGIRSTWNPAEKSIIEITAPFQKFISQTINITESFWLNYFYLVGVRQKNRQLKMETALLKIENSRYRELLSTHERLKNLIQFSQTLHWPVKAAQVIGRDPTGWFRSVIIDKGENMGLRLNMPVVNACGVVGRIVSISSNYSKVLLILDQNSAIDCLIQRSRDRGMVKGLLREICSLDYVVKSSDVENNDIVVTSGLGGVFPKGLPVGKVLNVRENPNELFKSIEIKPAVNFSKLEEVLVIIKGGNSSNHLKEKE